MIRYHGGPITPTAAAVQIWRGRHGMISFAHPEQMGLVAEVCQSFCIDNGAFSIWKKGGGVIDVKKYAAFVWDWARHPGFDFALVPDVIDGTEQENDDLAFMFRIEFNRYLDGGALPELVHVWHLHESLERLERLLSGASRIALGSSGEFSTVGSERWEERMNEAFRIICDDQGRPKWKVHGLRMMDPTVFSRYPFASVDSTNVARNIGIDKAWESFKYGGDLPKSTRGIVMADRCEAHASATVWNVNRQTQYTLLFG